MKITKEPLNQSSVDPVSGSDRKVEKPLTEREKLKSMSRKDKCWYIWEYYKFHMIGAVIAVAVIYHVGMAMYRGSFETVFYCMYINSYHEASLNTEPVEQGFAAYLGLGEKELITTESTFLSYGEDTNEYSYASMAKISALVAAKDLDVIIGDLENLAHYASMDGFLDLSISLPADLFARIEDRLVYTKGSDGVERPYGVALDGTSFAEESNLGQNPPVLGIMSNSRHIDNSVALFRYIFAQ